MKNFKKNVNGITLIALVITIIVLLILAGVSIAMLTGSNGLLSQAQKATEDYKEAQSEEEESIRQIATTMYSEYVGATVEGYEPTRKEEGVTIKGETSGLNGKKDANGNEIANDNVTDNGDQTFKADDNMNWRVWDFDGKTLRIIGDPTEQTLTLQGVAGYNNGVWAIEKICKELYSNEDKGAIATSLKRTDIQRVSTYDYTQYKRKNDEYKEVTDDNESDDENLIYFGESKTYKDGTNKYPAMWGENDKDWDYEYEEGKSSGRDEEGKKWEVIGNGNMDNTLKDGEASTEFKQSYYYHNYKESEFINDTYYDLIFKKADGTRNFSFWLASRYSYLEEGKCLFGFQRGNSWMTDCLINGHGMCWSNR